jgi:hypothetical protein
MIENHKYNLFTFLSVDLNLNKHLSTIGVSIKY